MSTPDLKEIIDREYAEAEQLVEAEIGLYRKSRYWVGAPGRHVSTPADYDSARMIADLRARFTHLSPEALSALIGGTIYRR